MHRNAFGAVLAAGLRPHPLGELERSPGSLSNEADRFATRGKGNEVGGSCLATSE